MFPTGEWVFVSAAIDNTLNTEYGYRYNTNTGGSIEGQFASQIPSSGTVYTITPSTVVFWGGDSSGAYCNCVIQYVRVYIDYAANTQDQMLNLAIMNPLSKHDIFTEPKINLFRQIIPSRI